MRARCMRARRMAARRRLSRRAESWWAPALGMGERPASIPPPAMPGPRSSRWGWGPRPRRPRAGPGSRRGRVWRIGAARGAPPVEHARARAHVAALRWARGQEARGDDLGGGGDALAAVALVGGGRALASRHARAADRGRAIPDRAAAG